MIVTQLCWLVHHGFWRARSLLRLYLAILQRSVERARGSAKLNRFSIMDPIPMQGGTVVDAR